MPEFEITTATTYLVGGYIVILLATTVWLFGSKQRVLAREATNVLGIALRLAMVFGLLYGVCWLSGIAVWFVVAGLALIAIVGMLIDIPFAGMFSFAMLYIVQQFVLGFPARHEWVLDSIAPPAENDPMDQSLVGQVGKTVSPLRPIGEVKLDGGVFEATANDGRLIERDETVVVIRIRHGKLIVRQP